MNWKGEYKVKCPKCGCRKIWVTEVIEAYSDHLIDNGVWNHEYDNNEYGESIRVDCKCDECGHKWSKPMASIDWFTDESKEERKENRRIRKMNERSKVWSVFFKEHNK